MLDVNSIRKLFPHTKKSVYFNAASSGPLSDPAYRLQDDNYRKAQMADLGNQQEIFEALDNIRRNGAILFGCRGSEVGFGFNTTFGLNLAAFGLPLKSGDEVLLSDVEFPANVYPWLELRKRGIKITFVKNRNGFYDIDNLKNSISRKTRVVSTSFVQFFNGFKVDLAEVGGICRTHGLFFVVDAIQGAGCEPMQLKKWGVDIASAGAQKWLLASQGSGLFYVSDDIKNKLHAPWRSWLGVDWKCNWADLLNYKRPFEASARQYELGTYPSALVLSLDWSLEFLTGLGIKNIQGYNHALLDRLLEYLRDEPGYRITSSLQPKHRSSILSFTVDRGDIRSIHKLLLKNRVVAALREGSIRISAHIYNNDRDIDHLIQILAHAVRLLPKK